MDVKYTTYPITLYSDHNETMNLYDVSAKSDGPSLNDCHILVQLEGAVSVTSAIQLVSSDTSNS